MINPHVLSKKRVAVGLSGGVDSSVSAYLLKEQGCDVVGVYMQCWDSKADGCTAEKDRADAAEVASSLGIKFEHLNFIDQYQKNVIDFFYKEYELGRTPNPDVLCNKEIKFGLFFDWAMKNDFDYVATGHYARVPFNLEYFRLLKGLDSSKDQSYFLYLLDQYQLAKTLFPVGDKKKSQIRNIAKTANLKTYNKPDSVGICFIGEVNIKDFLKQRIKSLPGIIVNTKGEAIGEHDGIAFYTVGQRHGFKIATYYGIPLYVVGKNVEKNELIVGFAKDVLKDSFNVSNVHFINPANYVSIDQLDCDVRIRHLGEMYKAKVSFDNKRKNAVIVLKTPAFAVAPGQSAVFYIGEELIGGGIIEL